MCPRSPSTPFEALEETNKAWQTWSQECRESGPYSEAVLRSLITLKALTYRPTGGIVAAPTTSLPESLGGTRNWDYRFCWLRDATFTLLALMNAGLRERRQIGALWLRRAVAGNPAQVQIMYGLAGERRLDEWEVPWLAGYEGAKPVRIGNAAAKQLQLDIYGEVMDALLQARRRGLTAAEHALGAAAQAHRAPRNDLAGARRGHLGGARRPRALHAFEGDGLGRVRPGHQERRAIRLRGPGRSLAQAARRNPRRGLRARLRPEARSLRPELRLKRA